MLMLCYDMIRLLCYGHEPSPQHPSMSTHSTSPSLTPPHHLPKRRAWRRAGWAARQKENFFFLLSLSLPPASLPASLPWSEHTSAASTPEAQTSRTVTCVRNGRPWSTCPHIWLAGGMGWRKSSRLRDAAVPNHAYPGSRRRLIASEVGIRKSHHGTILVSVFTY